MKLQEIKKVLDLGIPEDIQERMILKIIADDEAAIPAIMQILAFEREAKKDTIIEMNLLISKAEVCLENRKLQKQSGIMDDIKNFFRKHTGTHHIGHCFKSKSYERV